MSLPWIRINQRLQEGVSLINSLKKNKFNLLLQHIAQTTDEELFTPEQLKKLRESLKLDDAKLELLISSIAHIFKQSSKVILKPTVLQDQLVDVLKFDQDKAEDFVIIWTDETKKFFDLEHAKTLKDVAWEVNIQSASSIGNKQAVPNARVQFNLENVGEDKSSESVILELNQDDLLNLYNTLELVQSKLDVM